MKTALMAMIILALVLGGCVTVGNGGAFRSDGLPKQQYYVGGGLSFNYTPDQAGTLYLVEKNSSTFIVTQSLKANENLKESIDPSDEQILKRLEALGIDTKNMAFSIYFVPAEATEVSG